MESYLSMKSKLKSLNIYDIENSRYLKAELKAYAQEINRIDNMLSELLKEYFIETAQDYGLSERELFIGEDRSQLSIAQRREMLLARESINSMGFNKASFSLMLRALGLNSFEISENFSDYTVTINISDSKSAEEKNIIQSQVALLFPSHLEIVLSYV